MCRVRRGPQLNCLLADVPEFVHAHRPHGPLSADATEPAWERLPAHRGVPVQGRVWSVGDAFGSKRPTLFLGPGPSVADFLVSTNYYGAYPISKRSSSVKLPSRTTTTSSENVMAPG